MIVPALAIDKSTSGDTTLLAASPNTRIAVKALLLVSAGNTAITFKSGSTALTGPMTMFSGGSQALPFSADPWYICGVNEALVLSQTDAVQLSGRLHYEYIPGAT